MSAETLPDLPYGLITMPAGLAYLGILLYGGFRKPKPVGRWAAAATVACAVMLLNVYGFARTGNPILAANALLFLANFALAVAAADYAQLRDSGQLAVTSRTTAQIWRR